MEVVVNIVVALIALAALIVAISCKPKRQPER
jgi:hypothetical protein